MDTTLTEQDYGIISEVLKATIEKGGIISADAMLPVTVTYTKVKEILKNKKPTPEQETTTV